MPRQELRVPLHRRFFFSCSAPAQTGSQDCPARVPGVKQDRVHNGKLPLVGSLDIEVVFTGMRPGERLNEILFASEEPTVEIGVAGIMAAKPNEPPMPTLRDWLAALEEAIAKDDRATVRAVLKDAVPEFGLKTGPVEGVASSRLMLRT